MMLQDIKNFLSVIISGILFELIFIPILAPTFYLIMSFFLVQASYDEICKRKIQWAPLNLPLKRRLETICVCVPLFLSYFVIPIILAVNLVVMYSVSNTERIILTSFYVYNFYDHHRAFSKVDGLGCAWIRQTFIAKHARNYFPLDLVKTAELKPDKNYLIASFPHGVLSFGTSFNQAIEISKWLELFPGVRPKVATLDVSFYVPFVRYSMALFGMVSVSKKALLYYLSRSNDIHHPNNADGFTSNAVTVVVGGAEEAATARPGFYKLKLKNRKGFIRVAIQSGASIVPSFTFNEVDLFNSIIGQTGSLLHRFQHGSKNLFGIWPTLVQGRGFFQYNFGVLPHRKHVVQVVGAPIAVKKSEVINPAYVDELHQTFIKAIIDLFETHKEKYIENANDAKLIIY